jgi:hypothetical protein
LSSGRASSCSRMVKTAPTRDPGTRA